MNSIDSFILWVNCMIILMFIVRIWATYWEIKGIRKWEKREKR